MTLERKLAKVFHLTDENWMKHANPISVWSRYSVLPLIVLAFWSRLWIGWWCLVPVCCSIIWMFINPILFDKPKSTRNWASRAVLGERVYLNRDKLKIPEHHITPLYPLLNSLALAGLMISIVSTVYFSLCGLVGGILLTYLAKSWFLDRMVCLYEEMKHTNDTYRSWDY